MKITFLGTGAGSPTAMRKTTSIILDLMEERKKLWLFDCGESAYLQMSKAQLSVTKLEFIFMTHLHGDHLFGLPSLLTCRSMQQNQSEITLIGPKGIKQFVNTVLSLSGSYLSYPLKIIEISDNGVVFEDDQLHVETKLLMHRIPCFGYRITEKMLISKENNRERFTVAILGDTSPCRAAIELAKDVDILTHEATYDALHVKKAKERGHSTTLQAAEIAKNANTKKLIITHISPRYPIKDNQRLVDECKTIFENTHIATDLSTFKI